MTEPLDDSVTSSSPTAAAAAAAVTEASTAGKKSNRTRTCQISEFIVNVIITVNHSLDKTNPNKLKHKLRTEPDLGFYCLTKGTGG